MAAVHLQQALAGRLLGRLPHQVTEVGAGHAVTARVGGHRQQVGVRGQARLGARLPPRGGRQYSAGAVWKVRLGIQAV